MAAISVQHLRPGVDDDLLAVAYLRMKVEGLLEYLFWAGPPSLTAFLEWCRKPDLILAGVFCEKPGDPSPMLDLSGFGFLSDVKTYTGPNPSIRCGDVGEIFFREYQIAGQTGDMGHALLEFAFVHCRMTTLCGVTPEKNFAARRFMRRMGFTEMGVIPNLCCLHGEPCGGALSYLTCGAWVKSQLEQAA